MRDLISVSVERALGGSGKSLSMRSNSPSRPTEARDDSRRDHTVPSALLADSNMSAGAAGGAAPLAGAFCISVFIPQQSKENARFDIFTKDYYVQ